MGRAGVILDNLIASDRATPMIVVMPAGHTSRAPGRGALSGLEEFEREFLTDIMPHVERIYRVRAERASRAIAGLSMGGMHTLDIAVPHLREFAYVGVYSSGVFGIADDGCGEGAPSGSGWETRHRQALDDAEARAGLELLWFRTGLDDFVLETTRATVELLERHGFDVSYEETTGGHTWLNWRAYLGEFAPLLFR